jgi:tRNA-adenosine deaminase (EC 3.5.4.-)
VEAAASWAGDENRTIFENDPAAHAEILALRQAGALAGNHRLTDAVLVVTLEPCIMCLGAVIQARLAGVVYAAPDPKAGCLVSRMNGTGAALEQPSFLVWAGFWSRNAARS